MTLSIKGHHCELKDTTKAYVERKLRKLRKATRNLGSVEVKLSEERKGLIDAEIRVIADKGEFYATHCGSFARSTFDQAFEKLMKQLGRHVEKLQDRRRRAGARVARVA